MSGNHLAMSDEEFLKQAPPETGEPSTDQPQVENTEDKSNAPDPVETPEATEQPEDKPTEPEATVEKPEDTPNAEEPAKPEEPAAKVEPEADPAKPAGEAVPPTGSPEGKEPEKPGTDAAKTETTPNYEQFYETVMKPFVANGKTVELKSPEEAVQLMQMGANFTRKMQELAPVRKLVTMLQNNNLDEDKLSYLIDLDKKDPEAIKKLIKDSGLDPLDIDTNTEPAYREGSHKVTDAEVNFKTHLDDLKSNPDGLETLIHIDKTWDQASKEKLGQQPELMSIIHAQRQAGIYDQIVNEMDRRKTLGQLQPGTSFMDAYGIIGAELDKAGAFANNTQADLGQPANNGSVKQEDPKPDPALVATRTAAPKPDAAAQAAAAAAATRSTPATAKAATNFLSMSDEEFAKLDGFAGRV